MSERCDRIELIEDTSGSAGAGEDDVFSRSSVPDGSSASVLSSSIMNGM
jgi:hypothetical protein